MLVILREFQCTFKFQLFKILFSLFNQLYNSCFHFCNVGPYLLQCLISFRCLDVTRNVLPTKQAQIVHDGAVIHAGIKMPPVPLVNAFVLMAQHSRYNLKSGYHLNFFNARQFRQFSGFNQNWQSFLRIRFSFV